MFFIKKNKIFLITLKKFKINTFHRNPQQFNNLQCCHIIYVESLKLLVLKLSKFNKHQIAIIFTSHYLKKNTILKENIKINMKIIKNNKIIASINNSLNIKMSYLKKNKVQKMRV